MRHVNLWRRYRLTIKIRKAVHMMWSLIHHCFIRESCKDIRLVSYSGNSVDKEVKVYEALRTAQVRIT